MPNLPQQKQTGRRKEKILFVYAAKEFEKLKNMNRLRDQDIEKTVRNL